MTIRLFEDPDDRLSTVVQINCLASRDRGVLVGHVPPGQHRAQLPQDLLVAMGHSPTADDWPRSAATGWRAARAWMAGFEITELILYGAWRIKSPLARILTDIARDDGIRVSLVTLASMRRRLPAELGDIKSEPLDRLIDRPRTPVKQTSTADTTLPLPDGLPPLPPADVTCFVSECGGCIPDRKLANDFVRAYKSRIPDVAQGPRQRIRRRRRDYRVGGHAPPRARRQRTAGRRTRVPSGRALVGLARQDLATRRRLRCRHRPRHGCDQPQTMAAPRHRRSDRAGARSARLGDCGVEP